MFTRGLAGAVASAACRPPSERWLHAEPPVPLAPVVEAALQELAEGMVAVLPRPPEAPARPQKMTRTGAGQRLA